MHGEVGIPTIIDDMTCYCFESRRQPLTLQNAITTLQMQSLTQSLRFSSTLHAHTTGPHITHSQLTPPPNGHFRRPCLYEFEFDWLARATVAPPTWAAHVGPI